MGLFKRNQVGIERILQGAGTAAMVRKAAQEIASDAESTSGLPVEVNEYTTDRAAAAVVIVHPAGAAYQAKFGTLTRAAASIGVEVTDR